MSPGNAPRVGLRDEDDHPRDPVLARARAEEPDRLLRRGDVPRDQLEAEVQKYALTCARNLPTDTEFMQKVFFAVVKQYQGEYMGSLLSAFFESWAATSIATPTIWRWVARSTET